MALEFLNLQREDLVVERQMQRKGTKVFSRPPYRHLLGTLGLLYHEIVSEFVKIQFV